jgi:hypothetical protein
MHGLSGVTMPEIRRRYEQEFKKNSVGAGQLDVPIVRDFEVKSGMGIEVAADGTKCGRTHQLPIDIFPESKRLCCEVAQLLNALRRLKGLWIK